MSGAVFGVFATSYLHVWWNMLERVCERLIPAASGKISNTFFKVVIDQGVGAPFYVYTYYIITNFLQMVGDPRFRGTTEEAFDTTKSKADEMLWPTMMRHWKLWPAIHGFNFYYVPLHHRVLVQNLVLVGWSGYLSHLNNGGLLTPKKEVEVTVEIKRRQTVHEQAEIKRRQTANAQ
eukprot:CAMPEP_0202445030 /NCGR_PEP_ID=MMETSP1360-20130828/3917_1 /ASSEMBLY_ACC=CAM_ASM_000848 /TAXON_ID=515479 /ORGANISM="Licmophora paradoxa, Strain CCMP2313" /LENGTH=176 /DNA_ID=CAMNT_0049061155 /DNA_START=179 /DNA_END=709 /DNA_ORIENTATION=+